MKNCTKVKGVHFFFDKNICLDVARDAIRCNNFNKVRAK